MMPYQPTPAEEEMLEQHKLANNMLNCLEKEHGPSIAYDSSVVRRALSSAGISEDMIALVIGKITARNTKFNENIAPTPKQSKSPTLFISNLTTPESFSDQSNNLTQTTKNQEPGASEENDLFNKMKFICQQNPAVTRSTAHMFQTESPNYRSFNGSPCNFR